MERDERTSKICCTRGPPPKQTDVVVFAANMMLMHALQLLLQKL